MHCLQMMGSIIRNTIGRTVGVVILAAAAVLFASFGSSTVAYADDELHSELFFYSDADGGGQILADFDFAEHLHVELARWPNFRAGVQQWLRNYPENAHHPIFQPARAEAAEE